MYKPFYLLLPISNDLIRKDAQLAKFSNEVKEFAVSFIDDPLLVAGGLGTTAKVITKGARYIASAEIATALKSTVKKEYAFAKSLLGSEVGAVGRDITPLIKAEKLLKAETGSVKITEEMIGKAENFDSIRTHIGGVKELVDTGDIQKAKGLLNEPVFIERYKNVPEGTALFEVNRANIEVREAISLAEKGKFDEARKIVNAQYDRLYQAGIPFDSVAATMYNEKIEELEALLKGINKVEEFKLLPIQIIKETERTKEKVIELLKPEPITGYIYSDSIYIGEKIYDTTKFRNIKGIIYTSDAKMYRFIRKGNNLIFREIPQTEKAIGRYQLLRQEGLLPGEVLLEAKLVGDKSLLEFAKLYLKRPTF